MTLEESIRQIYNRVENETFGAASHETHILAAEDKIVVIARGGPSPGRLPAYRQSLQAEFAAELGCDVVSMRTDVSLADDEKMEIFVLSRPLR
ncbi:DUF2294 domain-containing protein [Paenibacillus sp. TRM 82003]|nr:DUF2294 domain-containing protein [Paenibacillus sp. TRM 82003]